MLKDWRGGNKRAGEIETVEATKDEGRLGSREKKKAKEMNRKKNGEEYRDGFARPKDSFSIRGYAVS